MSVLEALENYHDRCHPVVCTILDITSRLLQQGFRYRVLLATKSRRNHRQRASGQRGKVGDDALPLAVPLSDMKRVIMHHIF
ncbi:hypothetical protein TNCV_1609431 [Trichonephila clavipes]|nr:hypothetical protein TNCV_1609431 [Trichonephila clavipes]